MQREKTDALKKRPNKQPNVDFLGAGAGRHPRIAPQVSEASIARAGGNARSPCQIDNVRQSYVAKQPTTYSQT